MFFTGYVKVTAPINEEDYVNYIQWWIGLNKNNQRGRI